MKLKEFFTDNFDKIFKKKEREEKRKRLIYILTIFFVCLFVLVFIVGPIFTYQILYQEKVYRGVYVDGVNIGGLTKEEAINKA